MLRIQYVIDPARENWIKKSENILVWLSKMVLAQHFWAVY
jgi:hypothetical protein